MSAYLKQGPGTVYVYVSVTPNADRTEIVGEHNGMLKIKVTDVAEKGKANKAVIALLAHVLGLAKYEITLAQGASGSRKLFSVKHIPLERAEERLARAMR